MIEKLKHILFKTYNINVSVGKLFNIVKEKGMLSLKDPTLQAFQLKCNNDHRTSKMNLINLF